MKLSPSELRDAVTQPGYRLPVVEPGKQNGGPSTDGPLRKSIVAFHRPGATANEARETLRGALVKDFWKKGAGLTMAESAMRCLNTYINLAANDPRPAFAGTPTVLNLGNNQISVHPWIVLFDDNGFDVRVCLPGPLAHPLSESQRILIAAPAILAVAEELEGGLDGSTVLGAEVWELRSGCTGYVNRLAAEGAVEDLRALVERLADPL